MGSTGHLATAYALAHGATRAFQTLMGGSAEIVTEDKKEHLTKGKLTGRVEFRKQTNYSEGAYFHDTHFVSL
jgi:hypothetical protein